MYLRERGTRTLVHLSFVGKASIPKRSSWQARWLSDRNPKPSDTTTAESLGYSCAGPRNRGGERLLPSLTIARAAKSTVRTACNANRQLALFPLAQSTLL